MYKDVHFWRWGMGRSFNGSYAEYALLPAHHVFAIQSEMSWTDIAAVPETYFTAWGSLFYGLCLQRGDTILIRGGTCALGYAAIQIAKDFGCRVAATTHRESKLHLLQEAGADECILDTGDLRKAYSARFTKALELVGCKTLRDTLWCMIAGGIVCNTGVLGGVFDSCGGFHTMALCAAIKGMKTDCNHLIRTTPPMLCVGGVDLENFNPIKEIPVGVCLTGFHSNFPVQADIDLIFDFLKRHYLKPLIGARFAFRDIAQACAACDGGKVNGKIVVEM